MTARALATMVALLVVALAAGAPAASADWGSARVLSGTSSLQADSAQDPALSQDGRFAAFTATFAGTSGVWRKSLSGGALELIAPGGVQPSISGDGRYVAFTTPTALDPVNDTDSLFDVYVRDMSVAADDPRAYALASARDGSSAGLTYTGGSGAQTVKGGGALTVDGRSVVFSVLSVSDLAGPDTPSGQIAVRHLGTRRTELVSTARDPQTGLQTSSPAPRGATPVLGVEPTATISADGSTVAWLGANLGDITRVVREEIADVSTGNPGAPYVEPLWRRIADGPAAEVRRIVGGGDPSNPGCSSDGRTSIDSAVVAPGSNPCDGPFSIGVEGTLGPASEAAPRLSADGATAAVLVASAMTWSGIVPSFPPGPNAYVVDMRAGVTRTEALRPLTAWASSDFTNAFLTGGIHAIAISPDATHIALATERGAFPLSPPLLVDPAPITPRASVLYDIDLPSGLMRRVSRSYTGETPAAPAGGAFRGATNPAYSGDGRTLLFASAAPDLFYGDANSLSDVVSSTWVDPPTGPGPPVQSLSPAPGGVPVVPAPRLSATATSRADGSVDVRAVVPGAGRLRLTARAQVRTVETVRTRTRTRTGRRVTRAKRIVRYLQRTVAARKPIVRGPGVVAARLTLTKTYRSMAKTARGLGASLTLTLPFRGRTVKTTLPVTFRVRTSKTSKATSGKKALTSPVKGSTR